MPPLKRSAHNCSKNCTVCTNPRVILRPLCTDSTDCGRYRFTSLPASASLYNKPELSDIRITVGDHSYYAHRLVLCAASEVFKNMLDERWVESSQKELKLKEEDDCVKYFNIFLQYLYTGSIVISDMYVLPLFILADKYMVKPLYGECVKIIESGLKVYLVNRSDTDGDRSRSNLMTPHSSNIDTPMARFDARQLARMAVHEGITPARHFNNHSSASDSSDSDLTDDDLHATPMLAKFKRRDASACGSSADISADALPQFDSHMSTYLVATETFSLLTITKMLLFCQNGRIKDAALYNLEARLSKQLANHNYGFWNDIPRDVIVMMLEDTHFYCKEYLLFKAVKSWLEYNKCTESLEDLSKLLTLLRYPTLTHQELYAVDNDRIIQNCPEAQQLIREATRYQLFKDCCSEDDKEKWNSVQFQARIIKQQD